MKLGKNKIRALLDAVNVTVRLETKEDGIICEVTSAPTLARDKREATAKLTLVNTKVHLTKQKPYKTLMLHYGDDDQLNRYGCSDVAFLDRQRGNSSTEVRQCSIKPKQYCALRQDEHFALLHTLGKQPNHLHKNHAHALSL